MKPEPNPPRLMHDPELGPALQRAARAGWSAERLARNGDAIMRALSAPLAVPPAAAVAAAKAAAIAKIGLPVLLVSSAALWTMRPGPSPVGSVESAAESPPAQEQSVVETLEPPQRVAERAPVSAVAPVSTLPEQLELFAAARRAATAGRYDEALALLQRLRRDHPESPLAPDVRLAEIEYLAADEQVEAALTAVQQLRT